MNRHNQMWLLFWSDRRKYLQMGKDIMRSRNERKNMSDWNVDDAGVAARAARRNRENKIEAAHALRQLLERAGAKNEEVQRQFTAFILRTQAEGVENFADEIAELSSDDADDWWSVSKTPIEQIDDALNYADRLYKQSEKMARPKS